MKITMNPFLVFGSINLLLAIIVYLILLQTPNYKKEIKPMSDSKIAIMIYFIISIIVTFIGIILFFIW